MSDRWLVFPKHLRRTDGAGLETEENIKRIKKAAADAFVKLLRQTWDIGAQINLVISINSFFFFGREHAFVYMRIGLCSRRETRSQIILETCRC